MTDLDTIRLNIQKLRALDVDQPKQIFIGKDLLDRAFKDLLDRAFKAGTIMRDDTGTNRILGLPITIDYVDRERLDFK